MAISVILCVPGLGSYTPGMLRQARLRYPQVDEVFSVIDHVASLYGAPLPSRALFGPTILSAAALQALSPTTMTLTVFGASIAACRILTAGGLRPYALCGHSFGEIAALTAGGGFSVAGGAEIVCRRASVLAVDEGRDVMTALGASEDVARHLIAAIGRTDLAIACRNAPEEVVVSGPVASMARLEHAARALDLFVARLTLPYGSHHPSFIRLIDVARQTLAGVPQHPLTHTVYSPILNRRYTDTDTFTNAIAEGSARAVSYTACVRRLHGEGARVFIEAGPGRAMTRCAQLTAPGIRVYAPLYNPDEEIAQFELLEREISSAMARATLPAVAPPSPPVQIAPPPLAPTPIVLAPPAPTPILTRPLASTPPAPAPILSTPPMLPPAASAPAVRVDAGPLRPARAALLEELRQRYAAALDYPPEFLAEDTELEAELGVDSLKQTALLTRVFEQYALAPPDTGFRVWEYRTLGQIANLLLSAPAAAPAPASS